MPPRTKAAGGLMGFTASDSEPDFDDLPQSHASQAQPVKRPRGRPPASSKVTKPAQKQARSASVRPVARKPPSPRRALATKSSNTNATKPARGEKVQPEDDVEMLEVQHSSPEKAVKRGRGKTKPAKEAPEVDAIPDETKDEASASDHELAVIENDSFEPMLLEDDASDATVRRRLGDLTRKYEALETRHRELRQVGVLEAERNFERLQKQADDNAAAATKLINELKAELAAQTNLAKKGEETRRQLERSETKCQGLQSKVGDLNGSLAEAKSEIKTLSTKLAAFRSAEATVNVPGSALKPGATRAVSSDVVQAAQAKEDLYGDLTGLILRGVDVGKDETVFDCIQTGCNGTLHFKLAVDRVDPGESYSDVEFSYRPQLDDSRDEELIELLPDFLVEDIAFPRTNAAKFYARVMKSLTER
ncbi:chromosome segregation protein csm1/Pcs1 domain-containing protein [Sarocladium implicatum]|nr:chromosome segregation protein csm1/Pcs1 domain-containing protein [Sarocladium implicatum]